MMCFTCYLPFLLMFLIWKISLEPIIKKYTKIIEGRPVEVTEKEVTEERIIQGKLSDCVRYSV